MGIKGLKWRPIIDMGTQFTTELKDTDREVPVDRTDIPRYEDLPKETRLYLENEWKYFIND